MPRFVEVPAPLEAQIGQTLLERAKSVAVSVLRLRVHADKVVRNKALQIRIIDAIVSTFTDPVFVTVTFCLVVSWVIHCFFVNKAAQRILREHGKVPNSE